MRHEPCNHAYEARNIMRMRDASLGDSLFRYLWPTTLFEDASAGTSEERRATYRRNRERRIYLPHYGRVWSLITLLLLTAGLALSDNFPTVYAAQIAAAAILTAFTCSLSVLILIVVSYAWFAKNE
jgi:hypothetical protein